jgi:HSP20 family protein
MDAYRRDDEVVVTLDLPGIAPGKIDLTVEQNVLTIKAERRFDSREGDEVIAAERPHGPFTRQPFYATRSTQSAWWPATKPVC